MKHDAAKEEATRNSKRQRKSRRKIRATPPCKEWEPPPGGWRTPNAFARTVMRHALQPFARISLRRDTDPTGPDMIEAPDLAITPNDVRRARRALAQREG
jgi:hypothetical protein